MPNRRRPMTIAQRYLLVAAGCEVALGWTYGAATTESRARALSWLPFPPYILGYLNVALGLLAAIAAFRHRGLPQWLGWGAASLAPGILAAVWSTTALTRTPLYETAHAFAACLVGLGTAYIAVTWGRHRTWRLLLVIAAGLTAAIVITGHGDVTQWSAWSSAVVYVGWVVLIYLGAAATTPDGDGGGQ